MELENYYHMDECLDAKLIKKTLNKLQKEGKITYSIEGDVLEIKDLDLDESELESLIKIFDDNDIFAYPDYHTRLDEEDNFGGYDDYDDEEEELY